MCEKEGVSPSSLSVSVCRKCVSVEENGCVCASVLSRVVLYEVCMYVCMFYIFRALELLRKYETIERVPLALLARIRNNNPAHYRHPARLPTSP